MNYERYPVKPGDWVVNKFITDQIAKVKDIYGSGEDVLVDLVIYNHEGEKVGRESPHMGGPRTFEPSCNLKDWQRIKKPNFPIRLVWVPREDGSQVIAREPQHHLPDRDWEDKRAGRGSKPTQIKKSDFDPQSEAAALRMAAQLIRDAARKHGVDELSEKADELEKEAENISRPMI